jgi:hypothetical protein
MVQQDQLQPLSVFVIVGGAFASREWERAARNVVQKLEVIGGGYSSPLHVHVVFVIPGEVRKPKFIGARIDKLDEAENTLKVLVGLPERPTGEPDIEIRGLLAEAASLAEQYAREKGITDNLSELRRLLSAI